MPSKVISVVRVPGFHRWPAAPEPVEFLRERHRHLFTVRVEWSVIHEERAVEFFLGQHAVGSALDRLYRESGPLGYEFGERSCETIAREVIEVLSRPGALRLPEPSACEVWEDDENGSRVEARP